LFAFLLSLLAGLSTTGGSLFAFIVRKPKPRFLSFIMGFSAGVMIFVSFVELLQQSIAKSGFLIAVLFFFLGILMMLLIDMEISHYYEYEHELGKNLKNSVGIESLHHISHNLDHEQQHHRQRRQRQRHQNQHQMYHEQPLKKTSLLIALGIFIHNFPEGMATFMGALKDINLGIMLAVAIAIHNIPEGIAVAVPVYAANNRNKTKAFLWSFVTGLSEPLGAILVWLVLFPFINEFIINIMLAIVAGFMIYISLDELLPVSGSLGKEHISILGIMAGMFVMFISLIIL
jgi:ZIP family zinc transporter